MLYNKLQNCCAPVLYSCNFNTLILLYICLDAAHLNGITLNMDSKDDDDSSLDNDDDLSSDDEADGNKQACVVSIYI